MSKLLKPTYYNEKQQISLNLNAYVGIHDLTCKCENPLKCIVLQIYQKEKGLQFSKNQLEKWFTTTDGEETIGKEEDPFTGEDLDALFGEKEEDDTG